MADCAYGPLERLQKTLLRDHGLDAFVFSNPFNTTGAVSAASHIEDVERDPVLFFDVNPGKRRMGESPYKQWVRFSFGPTLDNLELGLDRLEAMLAKG